jgi:hypothetical protein
LLHWSAQLVPCFGLQLAGEQSHFMSVADEHTQAQVSAFEGRHVPPEMLVVDVGVAVPVDAVSGAVHVSTRGDSSTSALQPNAANEMSAIEIDEVFIGLESPLVLPMTSSRHAVAGEARSLHARRGGAGRWPLSSRRGDG